MTDITKAILKINPNAKVSVLNNNIDEITWLEETTPISKSDIQAQFSAVEFDNAMNDVRNKRNNLLKETDHLALSDNTLTTEMTTYRQALRDITNNVDTLDDIDNITWPTKP